MRIPKKRSLCIATVAISALFLAAAVPAGATEEMQQLPETVTVEGTLLVIPAEQAPAQNETEVNSVDAYRADKSLERPTTTSDGLFFSGAVAVVTDAGNTVLLEDANPEDYVSGQPVSAVISVPEPVAEELATRPETATAVESELVELALSSAQNMDAELEVISYEITDVELASAGVAQAPKPHHVDVFFAGLNTQSKPTTQNLQTIVRELAAYWKIETNGQIPEISVGSVISENFSTPDWCSQNYFQMWDYAADRISTGNTMAHYLDPNRSVPQHLLVLESSSVCGERAGSGLGSVGKGIHAGGLMWGTVNRSQPASWRGVTFHEFGHNVSLGHSNKLQCDATIQDTGSFYQSFDQYGNPRDTATNASCAILEYQDLQDLMGFGYSYTVNNVTVSNHSNVAALNVTHRRALGALSATTVVPSATQRTFTYDVKPSTDLSGQRVLEIIAPTTGETYYVEYRAGQGRDGASFYAQFAQKFPSNPAYKPGVRVLRAPHDSNEQLTRSSIALNRPSIAGELAGRYTYLVRNSTLTAFENQFTVKVLEMTATNAKVEVKFIGPEVIAGNVTIAGTPIVGNILAAQRSGWVPNSGIQYTYQWKRNGVNIAGATAQQYLAKPADASTTLTVQVTGTQLTDSAVTVTATSPGVSTRSASYVIPKAERLAGADRYATAVAISQQAYPSSRGGTIIIATGQNYPDALGAASLGAKLSAPMLLTSLHSLPAVTRSEVKRLQPAEILIVGGEGVISRSVMASLRNLVPAATVLRLSGSDRYATSAAIVKKGWPQGSDEVFIATGTGFADALSAGAAAGSRQMPVVLVPGNGATAPAGVKNLLNTLGVQEIFVAGGTGAVSQAIVNSISSGRTVERFAGATRYETSALIGTEFSEIGSGVYYANGAGFADALTGAAVAGAQDAVLMLTMKQCVPTAALKGAFHVLPTETYVLGGTGVLAPAVATSTACAS